MNNCNCSPISPIADPALKLEKFDFARVLRTLLTEAAQGSVSGAEPLENLDPPMRSLDRVVLESWPYIAALLSTYDAAIAAESYIPTAVMSLNGFIDILGYQPRPATASQGPVVAHVQKHSVDIGEGATFRAASADLEAQQVCAVTSPSSTSITLNTGVVSPIREAGTQPRLLLEAATAAPVRGNIVLFLWKDKLLRMHATEILAVTLTPGVDGSPYVQIDVSESPSISGDTTWENVSVLSPSQRAYALTAIFELAESAVTDGGTIDEGDESY